MLLSFGSPTTAYAGRRLAYSKRWEPSSPQWRDRCAHRWVSCAGRGAGGAHRQERGADASYPIGAYVDEARWSHLATWVLCADRQVRHLSGGVGIGGVRTAAGQPDHHRRQCFSVARSEVVEVASSRELVSHGLHGQTQDLRPRHGPSATAEFRRQRGVSGNLPRADGSTACIAVIVKKVERADPAPKTASKELIRAERPRRRAMGA